MQLKDKTITCDERILNTTIAPLISFEDFWQLRKKRNMSNPQVFFSDKRKCHHYLQRVLPSSGIKLKQEVMTCIQEHCHRLNCGQNSKVTPGPSSTQLHTQQKPTLPLDRIYKITHIIYVPTSTSQSPSFLCSHKHSTCETIVFINRYSQ